MSLEALFRMAMETPFTCAVPVKKVNAAEAPPLAAGLTTVTLLAPIEAMSPLVMAACNCVLEIKVVVRELPLNCTCAAGSKLEPVTVSVNGAPPAIAEAGFSAVITGALGAGVGAGVGNVGDGGIAVDFESRKLPPTSTSCPPVVLNARPFCPQRIRRFGVPLIPVILMEPAEVRRFNTKESMVTEPAVGWRRKNALFS